MELQKHWGESLETGDRVLGTIRHSTDINLNRHNVELIVVKVLPLTAKILACEDDNSLIAIPFNEIKPFNT